MLEHDLDARDWEQVQDAIALVTELYGAGLARVLELAGEDEALRRRLAGDELIATLLSLHDLEALAPDPAQPLGVPVTIGRKPAPAPPPPDPCCGMCGEPVLDQHDHVVNTESRSLMCTCRGCWLLFTNSGAGGGKYRAVPDRYVSLGGLAIAERGWDELQIPVSVAFFFVNSTLDAVGAFYPSPVGATESLLPLDAWERITDANEVLRTMEADVEALLVRRDDHHDDAYLVPIDACYELVGEMRRLWKGFDGGTEAREAMDAFFERLAERAA